MLCCFRDSEKGIDNLEQVTGFHPRSVRIHRSEELAGNLGPTAAHWIVLLYHAVVVHTRLPMIADVCSRNLAGEKVVHTQPQEAGVGAVADIPVPSGKIVMGVSIGFPGAVICGDAMVYIRDVHPELEAGVVHIRLAVYEGVRIQFRFVEVLVAMVGYMLIVYVEREEGVAHIHLLACQGLRMHFLNE